MMKKIFACKKPSFFPDEASLCCWIRDNVHFLYDKDYSQEDVDCALQYAFDVFQQALKELDKENYI